MTIEERQRVFENPTREYRGKPFWSWNGKLEEEELKRQIDVFSKMGFGGFFMHSRTGLETEYLGEEWFELINQCADYGAKRGLESWLYDEDRWPSGSAGGLVTKEEKYRAMFLEADLFSKQEWNDSLRIDGTAVVFALDLTDGIFGRKRILEENDLLREGETAARFHIRYSSCNDNYNGYCYLNTMNREATEAFLAATHEQYRAHCGKRLGKEIRGVFTDEPHRGGVFTNFGEGEYNAVPYTPGLFEEFEKRFGYSLKDNLPELFFRKKQAELSKVTRDYFELCQELFLECFAIPIADWCRENHMLFTGHVLHEDSLCCQAVMQGSLMRFYEYMDYPGLDMLCDWKTFYWAAKQVDSVARQLNKKKVLSELYGCTGWQMDFASYKYAGDWQALFGVNLRCPHLAWYTMKGQGKRDYPASIGAQSTWYPEYHYVEDYFSRIHAAIDGKKAICSLLVLNPVESVWARAYSGAFERLVGVDPEIQRLEKQYASVFYWLAEKRIDFDYGEEDILARYGQVSNGWLTVGACSYDRVLVAGIDTLRSSTCALLETFAAAGGQVIFAGEIPEYVDALPSRRMVQLAETCIKIPFEKEAITAACKSGTEVEIEGLGTERIYARIFGDKTERMVFLLNMDRKQAHPALEIDLGEGLYAERWNPRNGEVCETPHRIMDGHVRISLDLEEGGERLYRVTKERRTLQPEKRFHRTEKIPLPERFPYRLTEENVCVLDRAEVWTDSGKHLERREVLKADMALRTAYGIPFRSGNMLQPWYQAKYQRGGGKPLDGVALDYKVEIGTLQVPITLVVEDLEHLKGICINGTAIERKSSGKWIDVCFDRIAIPQNLLQQGTNIIRLQMDYTPMSGIEAVYLLGNFGVELTGEIPVLTALPEQLSIGDITKQGLPFYSGSVIYELGKAAAAEDEVLVELNEFGGSLVKVIGDTDEIVAFAPYSAMVKNLKALEVVTNRRNTFGPFHLKDKYADGYSPRSFVTEGEDWTEEYVLYEQGLLQQPCIWKGEEA